MKIDDIFQNNSLCTLALWTKIQDDLNNGNILPINNLVFKKENIVHAFDSLNGNENVNRKHVILIREDEHANKCIAKPILINSKVNTILERSKLSLVVGGTGGFGSELTNWLSEKNCGNMVITSRSGKLSDNNRYTLSRVRTLGMRVAVYKHDLAEQKEACSCFAVMHSMGMLQCVFNTAMTLEDKWFVKQTKQSFDHVLAPKLRVTTNLDRLTRTLSYGVQYFVMFSSISSGFGLRGQTNYGYGNSAMESVCENRRRDGLHGLAIQWGPIDEVGYVARELDEQQVRRIGFKPQSISSCLNVLDKLMQHDETIVTSYLNF